MSFGNLISFDTPTTIFWSATVENHLKARTNYNTTRIESVKEETCDTIIKYTTYDIHVIAYLQKLFCLSYHDNKN